MSTNYVRGRQKEYQAKAMLEGMGYHVTRAASSQGLADLVAVRADGVLLVQCKLTSVGSFSEDENCRKLRDLPVPSNVRKELWLYVNGDGLAEVRDLKVPRIPATTPEGRAARDVDRARAQQTRLFIRRPSRSALGAAQ